MNYLAIAQQMLDENYTAVGVRSVCNDESYTIGDDCRQSYDWDGENDCSTYHTTGLIANGTCATHIDTQYFVSNDHVTELADQIAKIVAFNSQYGGKQIIIAGNGVNNDGALDQGEVRIRNAHVIAVL